MGGVTCRRLGNRGAILLKHPFALIAHRPNRPRVRTLCYLSMCACVSRVYCVFLYVYEYPRKRHLVLATCQIYKARSRSVFPCMRYTHLLSTMRAWKLSLTGGILPQRSATILWEIFHSARVCPKVSSRTCRIP